MNEQQRAAVQQALDALEYWAVRDEFNSDTREAITALRQLLEQQPVQEPWSPNDTANRIGGLPQDFIRHEVENEGDWSEWVNPNSEQYFMKCCDCGLVHEMQFKVAKYLDGNECEFVDDPDLQPVFRARRAIPPAQPADHCEDVLHMVRPQNCGTGYCSCIDCLFKKGGK